MGRTRWNALVALAVLVVNLQVFASAEPSPTALLGGSPEAPRQASGSADGLQPVADTGTSLQSPQRRSIRPSGAVPDRRALPIVRGHGPLPPRRLTNIVVRQVRAPRAGTLASAIHVEADPDDTYVTSGSTANRSTEQQLKIGKEGSGGVSAAYLHFPGLTSTLSGQYITGAALNLYNVDSASCTPRSVDVFAVGAQWSGAALRTWPGAPLAQWLASREFAHGKPACAAAREAFQLPQDLVTDWTHGASFHGLSVRAANEGDPSGFKRFGSADTPANARPFLDVTYSPHGASYRVDEVTLPTAAHTGRIKATVRNRGSATWVSGGPHKFGFFVKQGNTVVQTSPKFDLPHNVDPNGSALMDVPIAPLPPDTYQVFLTMYDGAADYHPTYGVPYGVFDMKVNNVPPSVNYEQPGSGAAVDSIRPTLYAEGIDADNWPNKGLKYNFKLCDGPSDAPTNCIESGWTNATWAPPVGRLRWSQTYHWWVQAHDTAVAGEFAGPLVLTTRVPQPEITAHLGGTPRGGPAPGLDPQVGNFGIANTDASVGTVGPDLTVNRTYNSLDPRTDTAFAQGWASRLDAQLTHDEDGSRNEVVTLPSGRQVRFGHNHDGSYAPPRGQNLTLVLDGPTGYYTLRDASGSKWEFNPWGRLRTITDPSGLLEELEYDVAGSTGKPRSVFNHSSKRRLYLTWAAGHVTKVRSDPPAAGAPAMEWTYSYEGHRLTSVCDPALKCTRYDYQAGSHYRSVVLDDNPRGYWRLGELSGSGGALSATARTPGADKGTYNGVALSGAGALAGTADTAAAFDGAASRVDLPSKLTSPTMTLAVELWFRTTTGGVLMSYGDKPFGTGTTRSTPVLYVGQDGLLRGGFWVPKPDGPQQATSQNAVNDGLWHHAVLSASINAQTMYVDGVAQSGTVDGVIDHDEMPHLVVGTGNTKNFASGNDRDYFFAGGIDEVAVYQHPLGATAVAQHFAARQQVEQLTRITLPQDDRVAAVLTYDDINDRVARYTDHDGREWRLDTPSRNEAVRKVTLHGPYPDWSYEFDADHGGRLVTRTHDGKTRRYAYNAAGFRSEEIDELGHKVVFTTDARGNILSRKTCRDAGSNSCQTSYSTYFVTPSNPLDPRNDKKLSVADARSSGPEDTTHRTTYGYDALGRLISTTYPKPNGVDTNPTETWRYSVGTEAADGDGSTPAGLLIEHNGRRAGQVTRYVYRSNGDLAETVHPAGLRVRCEYDAIGRKTSETEMSASGAAFGRTDYTYTLRSQVATVTGPPVRNALTGVDHQLRTRYEYDANGNTSSVTLTDVFGADPPRTTVHEYDAHDRLIAITFPDSARETYEYHNAGQELRTKDPRGTTWIDYLDSQSRLLRRVASGAGVDPQDSSSTVLTLETRSYDLAGRLAATRDAMGRETRYTYYEDDRLATVTRSGVPTEQRAYDAAGNVTTLTAAGGRVTTTTYDAAGNPATVTLDPDDLKRVTTYLRDADGQVRTEEHTGAAEPGRTEPTSYGYDAAGRLLREDVQPTHGDTLSITYRRDERGLVVQQTDRRRIATDYIYDAHGRLVTETRPEVETWVGGQQQTAVRPRVTYGHNSFGDVTHQRDANGAVTVLSYDAMGRNTSARLPDYTPSGGQVVHAVVLTEYDSLGNPTKTTDALGRVTERGYDPHSRTVSRTLPRVGDQPSTTTVGYDRNGEQLSVTDPSGITRLSTYDSRGRKITDSAVERQPQTTYFTTLYGYDDADNLTSVTTPGGFVTRSQSNAAGERISVTDPTNRVTSYGYDIAGRQASVTDPSGVVTRTSYDLLGRPTGTAQLTGGPLVEQRRWQQSFDPNGNLLTVTSPEGRIRSFGYDAANRLVRQDERVDAAKTIHTTFGYDAAGNRTRYVDGNGRATVYIHNTWGLPESTIEPGPAAWTTTYDGAGQQVRDTAPGGITITSEYDPQGRLTRQHGTGAEASTTDKTFGYDPAGRLISFGAIGGSNALTYDDRGNLLTIRGPSGDATFTYTADSQIATRSDTSGSSSFSYDPAGRVASMVDGLSGRTIDHTYDAGGRLAYTAERGMERYVKRVNTYDPLGRRTSDKVTEFDPNGGSSRIVLGTDYSYDRDDNLTSKTTFANGAPTANSYGYDGADRLTSWTAPSGTTTYAWDDAGNRIRAGSTTFAYNERNQLTSDGTTQYTYTPRGTLASAGSRTPKFDAFDQLVQDGASFEYDSLGRVAKRGTEVISYGSLENDVVADGARLISRGLSGEPLADKAVGSTATAKLLYADQHADVVGRFRGLSSYGQRTFDPFGSVLSSSGEQSSLGYQGEWTEPTTNAVNMHSRWYTPSSGTFTSRDTWQIPPTPSVAANRYTYADAAPLGNLDPTGHKPRPVGCVPMSIFDVFLNLITCPSDSLARGCDDLTHVNGVPCAHAMGHICKNPKGADIYWCNPPDSADDVPSCRTTKGCGRWGGSQSGGEHGGGSGGGPGKRKRPGFRPPLPPPPPPLWVRNIDKAPPRPGPGKTVQPRPPVEPAADALTRFIDRTLDIAREATRVTEALIEEITSVLAGAAAASAEELLNDTRTDECERVGPIPPRPPRGPIGSDNCEDHLAVGVGEELNPGYGVEQLADMLDARHLMGPQYDGGRWRIEFLRTVKNALYDPRVHFSAEISGLDGVRTPDEVLAAAEKYREPGIGAISGSAFAWELRVLRDCGLLSRLNFYHQLRPIGPASAHSADLSRCVKEVAVGVK